MELAELETIINWTADDLKEGYFVFYTSRKKHYERLLRRIGGIENLISCRIETTPQGGFSGAHCKVPTQYLSEGTFSIRSIGGVRKSEARKGIQKGLPDGLKQYQLQKKKSAA
jgi:hypothetical protein